MPSFSGNKYETNVTTFSSGVNFAFPYVHPYTHMRSNQGPDWDHVIHYSMTQISMKYGMKRFGTIGVNAGSNEIKHLHLRNIFKPVDPRTLSKEEYDEVLESHLFRKEKIEKSFKGIMVWTSVLQADQP